MREPLGCGEHGADHEVDPARVHPIQQVGSQFGDQQIHAGRRLGDAAYQRGREDGAGIGARHDRELAFARCGVEVGR